MRERSFELDRLGPYRLEQTIAVGSIGEVFLAWRDDDRGSDVGGAIDDERPVVVKRLHRELARQAEHVELFAEEGRMARRFDHPYLVKAFDTGSIARDGGERDHYIAMELVRGPNLAQLAERGAVPMLVAARIALDLCRGLGYMHEAGVVHCDLSPTNILIGPTRTQLSDFGVASAAGTRQPQVRGTVAYMSPEQARGGRLDARSDIFSIGAVVWELLARRSLFLRSAPYLTVTAVVEAPVPDLHDPQAQPLEAVVRRALEKDPDDRWPSCAAMEEALAPLVE